MSAATALRVGALVSRVHPVPATEVEATARAFRDERGYGPPYWVLVDPARETLDRHRAELERWLG